MQKITFHRGSTSRANGDWRACNCDELGCCGIAVLNRARSYAEWRRNRDVTRGGFRAFTRRKAEPDRREVVFTGPVGLLEGV